MGDTGSLCLGATLGAYAITTRHELLLVVIGLVFVLETLSCLIQIISYKLTKKRIFPMTPIHHTFEKLGIKETDIVKIFWTIGLIANMFALVYGVWYEKIQYKLVYISYYIIILWPFNGLLILKYLGRI